MSVSALRGLHPAYRATVVFNPRPGIRRAIYVPIQQLAVDWLGSEAAAAEGEGEESPLPGGPAA